MDALVALENRCFTSDRLSRRQYRHLLQRGNAQILVLDDDDHGLAAAIVVLFRRATSIARLYSIAVDPAKRGLGLAQTLVAAAEAEAWAQSRAWMRLEVRKDNTASIGLFERLGYRRFGEYRDYYEDHMDAWRLEKQLDPGLKPPLARVPYYEQTLDFTCGAACLIMAMQALKPESEPDRKLELRLWREATTIFMTSGHGGCGPYGLALAAKHRGFDVQVFVSDRDPHLIESVRSDAKKEVMSLVQEDQEEELLRLNVSISTNVPDIVALEILFREGAIPVVLISSWQIYQERWPHWVVINGFDEHFIYVHDPFVDYDNGENRLDSINMPISREQFMRMARYGRRGLQAVITLR
ncbi:MAG: GNAT family N-acetyltransferase/peptidase C39 family protein [Gammaproteobacteria bacterium]|nr:GNAT family N-acetyltransferase/peptidase C39 family protein [Gammaproteobacteria bacterium]